MQLTMFGYSRDFTAEWWETLLENSLSNNGTIDRSRFMKGVAEAVADFLQGTSRKDALTAQEIINVINPMKNHRLNDAGELGLYLREMQAHRIKALPPNSPNESYSYAELKPRVLIREQIAFYEDEIMYARHALKDKAVPKELKVQIRKELRKYRYRLKRWQCTTPSEAHKVFLRMNR